MFLYKQFMLNKSIENCFNGICLSKKKKKKKENRKEIKTFKRNSLFQHYEIPLSCQN